MTKPFKILTELGLERFRTWIASGGEGLAPKWMLGDLILGNEMEGLSEPDRFDFKNKMEFGRYLVEYLSKVPSKTIYEDKHFWSTLSLIWFENIRPKDGEDIGSEERYVPQDGDRAFYRHLVRTNWLVYRDHGENARFMLTTSNEVLQPLSVHGEVLEQITGRQRIIGSKAVVKAANRLYLDKKTNRPGRGATGTGPATVRRFGKVIRQLDMTLDPETMTTDDLISRFPKEFEKWKRNAFAKMRDEEASAKEAA